MIIFRAKFDGGFPLRRMLDFEFEVKGAFGTNEEMWLAACREAYRVAGSELVSIANYVMVSLELIAN